MDLVISYGLSQVFELQQEQKAQAERKAEQAQSDAYEKNLKAYLKSQKQKKAKDIQNRSESLKKETEASKEGIKETFGIFTLHGWDSDSKAYIMLSPKNGMIMLSPQAKGSMKIEKGHEYMIQYTTNNGQLQSIQWVEPLN